MLKSKYTEEERRERKRASSQKRAEEWKSRCLVCACGRRINNEDSKHCYKCRYKRQSQVYHDEFTVEAKKEPVVKAGEVTRAVHTTTVLSDGLVSRHGRGGSDWLGLSRLPDPVERDISRILKP